MPPGLLRPTARLWRRRFCAPSTAVQAMYPHASPALIFCCSIPGRLALLLPLTLPYLARPACLVAQSEPNPTRHFFSTAHQPCCLGPMPTPACYPSCSQLTAAAKPYLYTPNESHCQITTAPNPESRPPSFPLWLPLRRYPPPPALLSRAAAQLWLPVSGDWPPSISHC